MASGCPCSAEDRSRRVLMVRRLHPAVSMQSLLQTFGAFGSITGCKVFTHKSGRTAAATWLPCSWQQCTTSSSSNSINRSSSSWLV
ncbi:hypothetical protein OEZ85_006074 [Tetradesmus obliquus]|uniref:RRM domain-containing protein n=1 Tax=Tetradesmus obliquus TaxID=3088 RepID=A0ABY8UFS3_TETOB|nr:hypothetical protein OEZ85_006074 [Tetradesmus obliquus]